MALWLTQMEMNVGKCTIWSIWQNVWLILDPDPPFEKHQRLLNLIIQKVKDTGKESKQQFRAWNRQQKMLPIFTLCKGKPISWNHWVQLTDPSHSASPSLFNKPFPSIREITLQIFWECVCCCCHCLHPSSQNTIYCFLYTPNTPCYYIPYIFD